MKELWITNVGSHMWHMERPDSDTDLFVAFVEDIRNILLSKNYKKSISKTENNTDYVYHEISQIVKQLIDGNVNFIWGVHSPIIIKDSKYLQEIRNITKEPAANIYNSIYGLAIHNYRKYIATGKDLSQKRLRTIYRTIKFGLNVLDGNGYVFEPIDYDVDIDDIVDYIIRLGAFHYATKLPEKPEWANELEDWLYNFRIEQIENQKV